MFWYLIHLQSDPISEDVIHDKMECFGALYTETDDESRKLPVRIFSAFLHDHVNILFP